MFDKVTVGLREEDRQLFIEMAKVFKKGLDELNKNISELNKSLQKKK